MKKAALVCVLLFVCLFAFGCGNAGGKTGGSTTTAAHVHENRYGYCQTCGEISQEAMDYLHSHLLSWYQLYLIINYSSSTYDQTVEITSVSTDGNVYYASGVASTLYAGKTYYSTFQYEGEWKEDNTTMPFNKLNLSFSEPTAQ